MRIQNLPFTTFSLININFQAKSFIKELTAENKKYCKQIEKKIKAMPKGDERKAAEKELNEYKNNFRCWKIWNKRALAKLKAKSDKYDQENL